MKLLPVCETRRWLHVAQTHQWWSEQPEVQKDLDGKGVVAEVPCGDVSTTPVELLIGQDKSALAFPTAKNLLKNRIKQPSAGHSEENT